jgi:hypothetical protein
LRSPALSCGTCFPVVKRGAHAQAHGSNGGGSGGKGEMPMGGTEETKEQITHTGAHGQARR